jgi:hypothetical protein
MPANPFSMVYSELWSILLKHPGFVRDVKLKNRIRFDIPNNRDPLKSAIGAADLPEVMLTVENITANIHDTSHTTKISRRYNFLVSTGDNRYTELLAVVEWEIFTALCNWQSTLSALQWKDKPFCKALRFVTGAAGMSNPQQNRNIVGWSSVWQCEIEMHFLTADLQAESIKQDNRESVQ